MGIQLVSGRDLSPSMVSTVTIIVNEAAARQIGYKNRLVKLTIWGDKKVLSSA
jgi:hypothetical protein